MSNKLPLFLCIMMAAAGGGWAWWSGQNYDPVAETLARIEPASGKPAETATVSEDPEEQTAYNGKNLTGEAELPVIMIGGLKVESLKVQQAAVDNFLTPASLSGKGEADMLGRSFKFTPYAHDPVRGPVNAPVTLVEFNDLACGQCRELLKKSDEARAKDPELVRQTSIHLPLSRYADTNMAAFYGKVAQDAGKYWEFREALLNNGEENTDTKNLMAVLIKTGVDERAARNALLTKARGFYRELDADAKLAKALGVGKPPHFFVNGVSVGDAGIDREKVGDVVALMVAKHKQGADALQPSNP